MTTKFTIHSYQFTKNSQLSIHSLSTAINFKLLTVNLLSAERCPLNANYLGVER